MMYPNWISQYIGIPFIDKGRDFGGCDCWGLLRLVYYEQFKIDLPSYTDQYENTEDGNHIAHVMGCELDRIWHKVDKPECGDAISLKIKGQPWHCGIAIDHRTMLHCMRGHGTVLERFDKWRWIKRIDGYYRHTDLFKTKPV